MPMTTSPEVAPESLTSAVARRLRGQLAEQRISQKEFGELTGWGRMAIYRRLTGETALDTNDLEHIEQTTGISVERLLSDPPDPLYPPPRPLRRDRQIHRKDSPPEPPPGASEPVGWLEHLEAA